MQIIVQRGKFQLRIAFIIEDNRALKFECFIFKKITEV